MATQAKVRLRWSSGALSLALHAIVIACALLFGMVSVEQGRRAPPLEATLLPLPEPFDIQDYRQADAPRAREDTAGPVRVPVGASGRAVPAADETPSFSPSPIIRDVGASGAEGAGPGGTGPGSGGGQGSGGASAGTGSGESAAFARPEWIERLSAAQMLPYFPRSAIQLHMNGTAWLACQVDARNRARRCRVLRETPGDYGFGHAALRMSRLFQIRPPQRDGLPQYDAWVRIQIDFEMP